jgi:two-component system sensor histidine kinase KdpD
MGHVVPTGHARCDHDAMNLHRAAERFRAVLVAPTRPAGLAASIVAVALVTGVIAALKPYIPVLSLGVLYVFAVLPIAVVWGLAYAVTVSVASMLAFNWFFLPPTHTFTLSESRNWFALAVFVVTAIVVSELAARARRRAREASLLAEIATTLLEHGSVSAELERISAEAARALQVERARIDVGDRPVTDPPAGEAHELRVGGRRVGTIVLEGQQHGEAGARRRLLPALASLLGVAIDRERLTQEALEAEALRRGDVIKTALLRAVSHDLRTPLMAISTSAGALARPDLTIDDADRAELLATILDASDRLDRLVDNLLDLSRLQAGAAQPEQQLWEVDELIVQALDELGHEGNRVEVTFSDPSPSVRVDAHQIERVLANLVENAIKYSPVGEPVRVQVAATPSEAVIRVIDHGPGVPVQERERIFEPFNRGTRHGDVGGAGLGLAIARGFAEANGGQLWVESRSGQGATFVLSLPTAPAKVVI